MFYLFPAIGSPLLIFLVLSSGNNDKEQHSTSGSNDSKEASPMTVRDVRSVLQIKRDKSTKAVDKNTLCKVMVHVDYIIANGEVGGGGVVVVTGGWSLKK